MNIKPIHNHTCGFKYKRERVHKNLVLSALNLWFAKQRLGIITDKRRESNRRGGKK